MSHLRMSTDVVAARSGVKKKDREIFYFFTQSPWQAIAHISDGQPVEEGSYVDPNEYLPGWVMKGIDYAIKRGAECHVTEYVLKANSSTVVGVILKLWFGEKLIGLYAVKHSR